MSERHKAVPAVYLIVVKDGKTLLYLRQNTGYCDGMYGLISGHVEKNEGIFEAMIREAKEEAGMELKPSNLELALIMYRNADQDARIEFFFTVQNWNGEVKNLEPKKCKEIKFFDLNKLPKNTIEYIQVAIDNNQKGNFFCEWGF